MKLETLTMIISDSTKKYEKSVLIINGYTIDNKVAYAKYIPAICLKNLSVAFMIPLTVSKSFFDNGLYREAITTPVNPPSNSCI